MAGVDMIGYARRRGLARHMYILAIIALLAVAAALTLLAGSPGEGRLEGLLIVVAYPGLEEDIKAVTCPGDEVVGIYPPGADPHDLQLDPAKARLVKEADVVVTMGHTPVDLKAEELARGIVVNVLETPGLILLQLPGNGANPHYPLYHPRNYILFIEKLAEALEEASAEKGLKRGDCSYTSNAARLQEEALKAAEIYKGALNGLEAVVDLPAAQYPAEWLGARVEIVLASGHGHAGEALDPRVLEEARRLLARGAVAIVTVGDDGSPVSRVGEWLLEEAARQGAELLRVKAPYTGGTVIDKLAFLAGQLEGGG